MTINTITMFMQWSVGLTIDYWFEHDVHIRVKQRK